MVTHCQDIRLTSRCIGTAFSLRPKDIGALIDRDSL